VTGPHSLPELLKKLNQEFQVIGSPDHTNFSRILPISDAEDTALVFLDKSDDGAVAAVEATRSRLVLVRRAWAESRAAHLAKTGKTFFLVGQPRLVAGLLLGLLHPEEDPVSTGVHATAIVSGNARIHPHASVGPYCVLGACVIGEGSRIGPFVRIGDNVDIGRRVIVREHAFVGSPGFGIVRNEADGTLLRIPHVGGVILEDDVEVFPFANVDRGTLTETRIRRGAKIDHYVHVAHNVVVGEYAIVTASSVLCGSSKIGARTWIGVGTLVKEGVTVGDDATTGLGAVVIRDVAPDTVVAGVPARVLPTSRAKTAP
jgi:UDP-3-O-[3-hydroxymyristoyl] glucosamine N-acyltransferase